MSTPLEILSSIPAQLNNGANDLKEVMLALQIPSNADLAVKYGGEIKIAVDAVISVSSAIQTQPKHGAPFQHITLLMQATKQVGVLKLAVEKVRAEIQARDLLVRLRTKAATQ